MRSFAITCKIVAIIFWLGTTWFVLNFDIRDLGASSPPQYRDAPRDWGTPAYYRRAYFRIAETAILTLLALTPNRFLVSSRVGFGISLIAALIPLWHALVAFASEFSVHGVGEIILSGFVFGMILGMFAPLPLSLLFSFLRGQKGETISYA